MFADTDDPWWLVLMPGVGFDNVDVLINVAYELSGVDACFLINNN